MLTKNLLTFFALNDEIYSISSVYPITILEVIKLFNYNKNLIVIEHNKQLCTYNKWSITPISNNDEIEIITIVGGG